ncbi:hypothetical protein BKH43_05735 [Helicobacter sp. 13S00401-1]|uniref:glycosyltransferase family 9 protein n=1 Tax=Helicobacter sp. 13S00401-1 TaxID=1905758 RepID=UPI000BA763BC|nr:glycosyltransferase family 9 protein [Helicobacter sp. 13S00401-1]PAF50111.1 hypothetical protein BKH43_05735 [Helicobacter sp. 13S00401-1]
MSECEVKKEKLVLIRLPNWLGDCIMLTPTLELLKRIEGVQVVLVGNKISLAPFSRDSFIKDLVIDSTKEDSKKSTFKLLARVKNVARLAKDLKAKYNFEYALTFQNAFFSALLLRLSGAKIRIGYSGFRSFLLTHPINKALGKPPVCKHQILSYATLLIPLVSKLNLVSKTLHLPNYFNSNLSPAQKLLFENIGPMKLKARSIKQIKTKKNLVLGISPGAAFGPSKMWLIEYFAEVASYFLNKDYEVRIYGAPSEEELGERLKSLVAKSTTKLELFNNLIGKTDIKTLIDSINECNVHIGNDSGNSQIATALNVPAISFYGPMGEKWAYPWSVKENGVDSGIEEGDHTFLGNSVAITKDLPCLGCKKRVCPLKHHNCMRLITPDEVIDLVTYLVNHSLQKV